VHATVPTHGPLQETHPEAQMYFAMNGSQPEVVAEDPYGPHPEAADAAPAAPPEGTTPAATEPAPEQPGEPASVKVIFPHDHG
jgi:hypothetical protein